ncbi:hypothetical protein V6N13_122385 [Hibiscus sabdariffa]
MNAFSHVPPGFRFHPTDEEFFDYYLRKKIASKKIDLDVIKDVDLYRIEPWDMQGRRMGDLQGFKKRTSTVRKMDEYESSCWYDGQVSFMEEIDLAKADPST